MRILLTGGTGYIGSAVLEELVAAGHVLVAVVRSEGIGAKAGQAEALAVTEAPDAARAARRWRAARMLP